jgi:Golgi SNAP receptor complex protein 2
MRDHSLREESFASQAEAQLDLLIEQGRGVLGSLVEQRGWLKGTRKRLLGAAGGIRGGREVVGWVERRRFVPLSHSLWIPS